MKKTQPELVKAIKAKQINQQLIDLASDIVTRAKNGEIVSGAFAVIYHNGETGNCFTDHMPMLLQAELSVLQREVTDTCIDLRLHKAGEPY